MNNENNINFKQGEAWPIDSAGRSMTQRVPKVSLNMTLGQVDKYIKNEIENIRTMNYIYVINDNNEFIGIFSFKELYRNTFTKKVKDIYRKTLIFVHPETDQEHAVYLALKNNIKAIPVVNRKHELLGVIPNDTILSILYKETQEDISRLAGESDGAGSIDSILDTSILKVLIRRLPWLIIGLLGGLMAAGLINSFENVLEKNLILAAFIPLIVYMAGAVSAQVSLFLIRDFAIFHKFSFLKYFFKQLIINIFIAFFSGLLLLFLSFFLYGDLLISYVLGIALVTAIIIASATGMVIPYIFKKLKQDPANASGPLGTIIQDVLSITIYFIIASLIL